MQVVVLQKGCHIASQPASQPANNSQPFNRMAMTAQWDQAKCQRKGDYWMMTLLAMEEIVDIPSVQIVYDKLKDDNIATEISL